MGGREDLKKAVEAIVAAKRDELGGPPTPGEILAYRDGRLEGSARNGVEARIAADPEASRVLADLADFPNVKPAPGTTEPSDEEIAATWQALRQKLDQVRPATAPPAPLRLDVHRGWSSPRVESWRVAAAAVVVLAAGWTAGYLMGGRATAPKPEAAVNVAIAELAPLEDATRSAAATVELPARAEELVLVLGVADEGSFPDYGVEILDAAGRPLSARQGLRPTELGTFHLAFGRGALPAGVYQIRLLGRNGEQDTLLATYGLRLLEASQE